MRAHDSVNFQNISADTANFALNGGAYVFDAVGNFNSGSATLQRLGPDGATFITAATALSAVGTSGSIALPPGTYKLLLPSLSVIRSGGLIRCFPSFWCDPAFPADGQLANRWRRFTWIDVDIPLFAREYQSTGRRMR
jgi:hypothetical protein